MKHLPSCRTTALITTATGVALAVSAFGVTPALADTLTPATSTPAASTAPAVEAPSADQTPAAEPAPAAATTPASTPAPAASTPAAVATPAPAATSTPSATTTPSAAPAPAAPASTAPASTAKPAGHTKPGKQSTGTDTNTEPTSAPTDTASATPSPSATPTAPAPSYSAGATQSDPVVLPSVVAGQSFTADLRAEHAKGATYTLTTKEGGSLSLPTGVTFANGVLAGTPTYAGTFIALVTATTDCGSASEWVTMTVAPAPTVVVGVVANNVPTAADGSYSWITSDGSSHQEVAVDQNGSITLTVWGSDEYGNASNETAGAYVQSDFESDQISSTGSVITITFPHASMHTIGVLVDGIWTWFCVDVTPQAVVTPPSNPTTPTDPTTPTAPSTPTVPSDPVAVVTPGATISDPVTPVAAVKPVATSGTVATQASTDSGSLAYTGSDPANPLAWALGLLAAGAAVTGLRFRRRRRH